MYYACKYVCMKVHIYTLLSHPIQHHSQTPPRPQTNHIPLPLTPGFITTFAFHLHTPSTHPPPTSISIAALSFTTHKRILSTLTHYTPTQPPPSPILPIQCLLHPINLTTNSPLPPNLPPTAPYPHYLPLLPIPLTFTLYPSNTTQSPKPHCQPHLLMPPPPTPCSSSISNIVIL